MFKKIDAETKLVALSAVNLVIATPFAIAHATKEKTKRTAKKHPLATSLIAGAAGSVVLAVTLVDGDKVDSSSRYAKLKNS